MIDETILAVVILASFHLMLLVFKRNAIRFWIALLSWMFIVVYGEFFKSYPRDVDFPFNSWRMDESEAKVVWAGFDPGEYIYLLYEYEGEFIFLRMEWNEQFAKEMSMAMSKAEEEGKEIVTFGAVGSITKMLEDDLKPKVVTKFPVNPKPEPKN